MKLFSLLSDINPSRTKLIRHNITNDMIYKNYNEGYLDIYQSIQKANIFKNCDYVCSFLGEEGTNAKYLGCYKVDGYETFCPKVLPEDFYNPNYFTEDCVQWKLTKTDILEEFQKRLVIDWGKGTINWCQNGTTEKEILYILPQISDIVFASYDKVILTYENLKYIVSNPIQHKTWQDKLSSVAGVYLITDTHSGKHYIGSASSERGGIWGRWREYVNTKHGGNKRLRELITTNSDYCNNFQFSILEVFPIKRDIHEVLECEQLYKRKFWSIQFGLNDN